MAASARSPRRVLPNVHSLLQLQYRVKLKPTYEAVGTARVAAAFHRKPLNRATMRVAAA